MGGDFAPSTPVSGALRALRELDDSHRIQLVGRSADLERELADNAGTVGEPLRARIDIVDAPDVIGMTDRPTSVLRGKPNNSMSVGLRLQAEGNSDAFVSAGNTGAQMAASALLLKLHPGLTRPAIATVFPTAGKSLVFLDAGANVDCSARELLQFAIKSLPVWQVLLYDIVNRWQRNGLPPHRRRSYSYHFKSRIN